jgi:xanthine dehydrogenase YagS FAD-binding subunit
MRPFRYERPADAAAAVGLLAAEPDAVYLAGGTNLVDLMRLGVATPAVVVDVRNLVDGDIVDLPDGGLRIGAGTRNSDLAADPRVRARWPVLSQALLAGASGQLRNMATVGGNLLQRTRCVYFQDVTKPCNKRRPGAGCAARGGDSRNLAILGHSEACVATHPSDMAVALVALGAVVHVEGADGRRALPMPGFHRLPGDAPDRDTVLAPGELITAVELPSLPAARRSVYRKVRDRAAFSFAVVSVAAAVELTGGQVSEVRVGLGGVAHAPWRAERCEELLRGGEPSRERIEAAVEAELAAARPLPDNAFKVPLARRLLVRTLLDLTTEAQW